MGYDTVDLDFNHNTVPGSEAYKADKEPRKRAAFGPLEVVSGEGVYLTVRDWTPDGRAAVEGKHFQDLSPSIITNAAGEVIFVHSVALCRQGCTEGLEIALNSPDLADLGAKFRTHSAAFSQPIMDKYKALLLTLLGLAETADDTAIEAAAKGLASKVDGATKAADAATSEVKTMSADLKSLRELIVGAERDILVRKALSEGKLVTNSIAALPLDSLKAVLAELPTNQVPLEKRTPEGIKTHSSSVIGSAEAATEAEVNRQLGIKAKA
jgi:phage I-like protein